jgi:hypothetical protein
MKITQSFTAFLFLLSVQQLSAQNTFPGNANVGIGTTTPPVRLTIATPTNYTGDVIRFVAKNEPNTYSLNLRAESVVNNVSWVLGQSTFFGGDNNLLAFNGGNIGIGTTSPSAKLHLNGNMRATNEIRFTNSNTMKGLVWGGTNFSSYFSRIDDYNGQLGIYTDDNFYIGGINSTTGVPGAVKFYVNTVSGNVGIGNTSPSQRLQVEGNSYLNGVVGINRAPDAAIALAVKGSLDVKNSVDSTVFHVSSGKQLVFVGTDAYSKYQTATTNGLINTNDYSLWVSKGINAQDFAMSDVSEWNDFVFDQDYQLPTLQETEAYILANKHLPNIPSAAEVMKRGYSLHTLNRGLLQTVEEMTLHSIAQQKQLQAQQVTLQEQAQQLQNMANELAAIKALLATKK